MHLSCSNIFIMLKNLPKRPGTWSSLIVNEGVSFLYNCTILSMLDKWQQNSHTQKTVHSRRENGNQCRCISNLSSGCITWYYMSQSTWDDILYSFWPSRNTHPISEHITWKNMESINFRWFIFMFHLLGN
jgi:hypothetical protein